MRKLLSLTLSFVVCFPGLVALYAAPARAQEVASVGNIDTLRQQYEQMLAVERNAATPPEVRELNRTFLEERRAQLAAAIRNRIGTLNKYRAVVAATLSDDEKRIIEDSIARLSGELQALLPEAVPPAARRSRRPARAAAVQPAPVVVTSFEASAPASAEPASAPDSDPEPARSASPIRITSPDRDKTVRVKEVEVEVSVGDENIDDLMVAVYTQGSGQKPATARTLELKRSDHGRKTIPVELKPGENRIEVSDLKHGEVLSTRTLTYAPTGDVLNAPTVAGEQAAPATAGEKSLVVRALAKADEAENADAAVICGQLQLASLNRTFALIRATPELGDIAARFRGPDQADPRRQFPGQKNLVGIDFLGTSQLNEGCGQRAGVARDGLQRSAAIDLLRAVLLRLNSDLTPKDADINDIALTKERSYLLERTTTDDQIEAEAQKARGATVPRDEKRGSKIRTPDLAFPRTSAFSSLSSITIRKQIALLEDYLGNVEVTLTNGETTYQTFTDRDGNYVFVIPGKAFGEGATAKPIKFNLSTEGDQHYTTREVTAFKGDRVRVNLDIEDRPVSLLARTIVGYDQSGAAAAKKEQSFFFDFFISKSFPFRQKINPDFGERLKVWGDFRINSVPQTGDVSVGDFAGGGFTTAVSGLKVKDVARVFEVLGGLEYRLTGNNALLPSFDRQTKQKFSISLIGSYGIVTPLDPLEKAPTVFKVFEGAEGLPPAAKGKEFVAFVPVDRDRFYRQYFAGLRVQTFFFNKYNVPMQRFPAQFDLSVGQNEFVTGGRLHGPVIRMESFFPLPYEKAKFINLFAAAQIIPGRPNIGTPLVLQPAPADTLVPAANVALIGVPQPNRDHYRIGIGIDFIPFFQKLVQPKTSGGSAASAGGTTPAPSN
ncbi:MAG: hypothetical protein QOH49_4280 [Acidobacteriota bacterium]|jgi:hypothetical protein|nr:hypothetical protein [Acidobacteriota bacterium]